ncbi:MAG TPA: hypothetical protein VNJ54_04475 [Plantibacter sp.]|uniref:hypothetical protein n=1 Tax=unclassified Plantibacter TaxID=2624265 RepID=UPI002BA8981A|nr:hypothetical protein [Plantibacter sp.]
MPVTSITLPAKYFDPEFPYDPDQLLWRFISDLERELGNLREQLNLLWRFEHKTRTVFVREVALLARDSQQRVEELLPHLRVLVEAISELDDGIGESANLSVFGRLTKLLSDPANVVLTPK